MNNLKGHFTYITFLKKEDLKAGLFIVSIKNMITHELSNLKYVSEMTLHYN